MKDDLISRQAAIDKMMDLYNEDVELYGVPIPEGFDGHRAVEAIKEIPSAQPERKKGRWGADGSCPFCGKESVYNGEIYFQNYCPNCGAKMMEDKK
jgi:predicted RNA-binding Zn-ribbon protein involved in translation (DUF1610 family)